MNILTLTTIGEETVLYSQRRDETIGGLEEIMISLHREIKNKGNNVILTCCAEGYFYDKAKENGLFVKTISTKWIKLLARRLFPLLSLKEISREIKENNIDIIHAANFAAGLIGGIAGKLCNVPVVISVHQEISIKTRNGNSNIIKLVLFKCKFAIIMLMRKISFILADRLITVSDLVRNDLINNGFNGKKISTIINSIDIKDYNLCVDVSDLKKELLISNEAFVAGYVGRLVNHKGVQYFINGFGLVKKEIPNIKFLIVGDGPEKQVLQSLPIYKNNKDSMIFTGFRTDIQKIYSLLDIIVQPSLLEGFSGVVLQAMAMRKPVIATESCGDMKIFNDRENIWVVKPADTESIAKAIIILYKNVKLREKISRNAREFIESNFSLDVWVNKYINIFNNL